MAICASCGHVQHYPLYSQEEMAKINVGFFSHRAENTSQQLEANSRRMQKLMKTLGPFLADGMNVLDVGAADGWAMEELVRAGCHYSAIEAVDALADAIRGRGGAVVGASLHADYPTELMGSFDLVIMRHVLEHLLDPVTDLQRAKEFLKRAGMIYVALPNSANPRWGKGFRTHFLRPTHVSYFHIDNLIRMAARVGLAPKATQCNGELSIVFTKNEVREAPGGGSRYSEQLSAFRRAARAGLWPDFRNVAKRLLGMKSWMR